MVDCSVLSPLGRIGEQGCELGQFDGPTYATILPSGDLCVADTANNRLHVVSAHGVPLETIGDGRLRQPRGVAADGAALYVAEVGNGRLQKMRLPEHLRVDGASTPRGSLLGDVAAANQMEDAETEAEAEWMLTFPQGVCLADGSLFVTDCEDHRVAIYDPLTLRYRSCFGAMDDADDELGSLNFPYGVAAYAGEVFVADVANHRVAVFSGRGEVRRTIGGGEAEEGEEGEEDGAQEGGARFDCPRGVAVARGLLFVAEAQRLHVLTLDGVPCQSLPVPAAVSLWGVCANASRLYAVDKGAHCVHTFAIDDGAAAAAVRACGATWRTAAPPNGNGLLGTPLAERGKGDAGADRGADPGLPSPLCIRNLETGVIISLAEVEELYSATPTSTDVFSSACTWGARHDRLSEATARSPESARPRGSAADAPASARTDESREADATHSASSADSAIRNGQLGHTVFRV